MSEDKNAVIYSDSAYDDAFRTLESECDDLVIPFVNHMFGEDYDGSAKIRRLRNEHFVEHSDGSEDKRITDSYFEIISGKRTMKYHLECESSKYDGTILVRMFEYDTQIAIDDARGNGEILHVKFPNTGLLLLRKSGKAPKEATAEMELPDGNTASYAIPIIRMSDYTIDDIFEKKLFMLVPFYIFNYEKQLGAINKDADKVEALLDEYRKLYERLETELNAGNLSALSFSAIIRLTYSVAYKLTVKRRNIQQKVGDVMGGKVLDLPEFKIYRQAKKEGIEEGIEKGISTFIEDKLEDGVPSEIIMERLQKRFDLTEEKAKEYLEKYS